MKQLLLTGSVLTAMALTTSAHSEPTERTFAVQTTGALVELCSDTSTSDVAMTTAAQNFCHGYLLGAYQVLAQINAARGKRAFCIPTPSPTRNEAIADFVSWAKANPSESGRPPSDGIYEFLAQRFPCPAGQ